MTWLSDPAELCSTLDLDDKRGLTEAIMIAIASLKDTNGKYVMVRLSSNIQDQIHFADQIADTLIRARELRSKK
jgi:hypothetical protein